jgi:hypothetical protein
MVEWSSRDLVNWLKELMLPGNELVFMSTIKVIHDFLLYRYKSLQEALLALILRLLLLVHPALTNP